VVPGDGFHDANRHIVPAEATGCRARFQASAQLVGRAVVGAEERCRRGSGRGSGTARRSSGGRARRGPPGFARPDSDRAVPRRSPGRGPRLPRGFAGRFGGSALVVERRDG
jgi:hypothetical protein